jgi:hypothetical protein
MWCIGRECVCWQGSNRQRVWVCVSGQIAAPQWRLLAPQLPMAGCAAAIAAGGGLWAHTLEVGVGGQLTYGHRKVCLVVLLLTAACCRAVLLYQVAASDFGKRLVSLSAGSSGSCRYLVGQRLVLLCLVRPWKPEADSQGKGPRAV